VLMTTGTVAAARVLEHRLPPRTRHQYVPVDVPNAVERFLRHWHPDLAIWVESELWPNLALATQRRGIPLILANARLSARSQARWQRFPGLVRPMLGGFSLCLAQDEVQAERLRSLGAEIVECLGDLKAAAPPLSVDPAGLARLSRQIGTRPLWLAASTHPGEEEFVAAAHARVARAVPELLTIVAPRHPVRGPGIADMLEQHGLNAARRAAEEPITPETDVYIADTLGELGLFFCLCGVAFIGGSLVRRGGHNPFEAARLDCAILHGPDMSNCAGMAEALRAGDACERVEDTTSLADAVARLLRDPAERDRRADAAARVAAANSGTLDAVLERLAPFLDKLGPVVEVSRTASIPRVVAGRDARP